MVDGIKWTWFLLEIYGESWPKQSNMGVCIWKLQPNPRIAQRALDLPLFSPYKRSKFHNSIPPEQAHHHLNMVSISGPYREMQIIFHLLIQRTQEKALLRSKLVALTTCKQAKSYHSWLLIFLGQCLHFLATRKCFLSSIPQLVS